MTILNMLAVVLALGIAQGAMKPVSPGIAVVMFSLPAAIIGWLGSRSRRFGKSLMMAAVVLLAITPGVVRYIESPEGFYRDFTDQYSGFAYAVLVALFGICTVVSAFTYLIAWGVVSRIRKNLSAEFGEHPPNPADAISEDLRCCYCGYNLRTLGVSGQCPECSAPVLHSIQGRSLPESGLSWLTWIRFALVLLIAFELIQATLSILNHTHAFFNIPGFYEYREGIYLCLTFVDVLAIMLLTRRSPNRWMQGRIASGQTMLRSLAILSFVSGLVSSRLSDVGVWLLVLSSVRIVAYLAANLSLVKYLQTLLADSAFESLQLWLNRLNFVLIARGVFSIINLMTLPVLGASGLKPHGTPIIQFDSLTNYVLGVFIPIYWIATHFAFAAALAACHYAIGKASLAECGTAIAAEQSKVLREAGEQAIAGEVKR
jgi:hypothetical protein